MDIGDIDEHAVYPSSHLGSVAAKKQNWVGGGGAKAQPAGGMTKHIDFGPTNQTTLRKI